MEKLDHHHIVKLVGTYCLRQCELYLLLWPVAVCNLDSLFNDLDALRVGHGDREDTLKRLAALEITDLTAFERKRPAPNGLVAKESCPLEYLRRVMGCIAHAVAYCHGANIRHVSEVSCHAYRTPCVGVGLLLYTHNLAIPTTDIPSYSSISSPPISF